MKEEPRPSDYRTMTLSGYQAIRLSGYQAIRLSGYQAIRRDKRNGTLVFPDGLIS
jgi:hypothetical protein